MNKIHSPTGLTFDQSRVHPFAPEVNELNLHAFAGKFWILAEGEVDGFPIAEEYTDVVFTSVTAPLLNIHDATFSSSKALMKIDSASALDFPEFVFNKLFGGGYVPINTPLGVITWSGRPDQAEVARFYVQTSEAQSDTDRGSRFYFTQYGPNGGALVQHYIDVNGIHTKNGIELSGENSGSFTLRSSADGTQWDVIMPSDVGLIDQVLKIGAIDGQVVTLVWGTGGGGGSGDVVGPTGATDTAVALYDGATGKLIKNSLVTVDAGGSVNIPAGQEYTVGGVRIESNWVRFDGSGNGYLQTSILGDDIYLRLDGTTSENLIFQGQNANFNIYTFGSSMYFAFDSAFPTNKILFHPNSGVDFYAGYAGASHTLEVVSNNASEYPVNQLYRGKSSGEVLDADISGAFIFKLKGDLYSNTGAQIISAAAENWTDVDNGSSLHFSTIPVGGIALIERLMIDGNGHVVFNSQYKFPLLDGDVGQVLTTDGAGTLSFADGGGGGGTSFHENFNNKTTISLNQNVGQTLAIGCGAPTFRLNTIIVECMTDGTGIEAHFDIEIYETNGEYLGSNSSSHEGLYPLNLVYKEDNIAVYNTQLTENLIVSSSAAVVSNTQGMRKYDLVHYSDITQDDTWYRIEEATTATNVSLFDNAITQKDSGKNVHTVYEKTINKTIINRSSANTVYVRITNRTASAQSFKVYVQAMSLTTPAI